MIEHRSIPLDETEELLETLRDSLNCTAALLNYRQSLLTPKMERLLQSREQRELERFLNDEPPTVAEMRKEWNMEKSEDQTWILLSYKGNASEIHVPDRIGKYEVGAIGDYAFSPMRPRLREEQEKIRCQITSVTIPHTVKKLGKCLFQNCSSLEIAEFSDGVTEIPDFAFMGCEKLESVSLPDTLKKIGESAFADCSRLTEFHLPDSVETIGSAAFGDCEALREVHLPENLKEIPVGLFEGCVNLHTVNIPESVCSIGIRAFRCCSNLEKITLSENVREIGKMAFRACPAKLDVQKGSFAETYLNENQDEDGFVWR